MRDFDHGPALLFCPADRPDRYAKALERADSVILDLEDAVAPAGRVSAREAMAHVPLEPSRVIVRVNPAGSADFADDLDAVIRCGYDTVMLAKTSSAADVHAVESHDASLTVVALCESAAGIVAAGEIAAASSTVALMWGAEDLIASLGGTSSRFSAGSGGAGLGGADSTRAGKYRAVAEHARSVVLLAAGAHGKAAIDTVHLDIADLDGLRVEAEDAVASGFAATACIHPTQAQIIRDAYRPDAGELARARALLSEAANHSGVFRYGDAMVDGPVLRHAEALVRRAGA
ncbi:MAG TPA: CoA ester lyase [Microbacteriaceae bacterium]|nr:CoA ester lyase [Microbacteriaceae bacterium]